MDKIFFFIVGFALGLILANVVPLTRTASEAFRGAGCTKYVVDQETGVTSMTRNAEGCDLEKLFNNFGL